MYKLGMTAEKLRVTYDSYKTAREAAAALGVSSTRILILAKKLGITKWNHPRSEGARAIASKHICAYCKHEFEVPSYLIAPHKYCSKRCQGKDLGEKHGFGVHPDHQRRKN